MTKCAAKQAFVNLGNAFKRFINGQSQYPKFKKKSVPDSFYLSNDQFQVASNRIRIPKLGWVKLTGSLRFSGKIQSATVSRCADKWFVSISVQMATTPMTISKNQADKIGMDLGVTHLATLSNGKTIEGRQPLKKLSRRLKRQQRPLASLTKGSNRHWRSKQQISKLHNQIHDIRLDSLRKLTPYLCQGFKVIGLEDLNVKGMMKNHKIAKIISDMGFYELRRQLEYKARLYGNWISIVDQWFPSSKTCSHCGYQQAELKRSQRTYHKES